MESSSLDYKKCVTDGAKTSSPTEYYIVHMLTYIIFVLEWNIMIEGIFFVVGIEGILIRVKSMIALKVIKNIPY
jgi:hypothetical protein